VKVRITRVDKTLPLPEYKTEGAVAFDMYSRQEAQVAPGEMKILPANFIIEVPVGYALIMAARSSLAPKKGLVLRNGIGIFDNDFRGPQDEMRIVVYNFTDAVVEIKRGERLAQGLIIPIEKAEWEEADAMTDQSRGGFGTTGQ
jgi:dUTP pyrophosphatase